MRTLDTKLMEKIRQKGNEQYLETLETGVIQQQ